MVVILILILTGGVFRGGGEEIGLSRYLFIELVGWLVSFHYSVSSDIDYLLLSLSPFVEAWLQVYFKKYISREFLTAVVLSRGINPCCLKGLELVDRGRYLSISGDSWHSYAFVTLFFFFFLFLLLIHTYIQNVSTIDSYIYLQRASHTITQPRHRCRLTISLSSYGFGSIRMHH